MNRFTTLVIILSFLICGWLLAKHYTRANSDAAPIGPMPTPHSISGCGGGPLGTYSDSKRVRFFMVDIRLSMVRTGVRQGIVSVTIKISMLPTLSCDNIQWKYDSSTGNLHLVEDSCYKKTIADKITKSTFRYDYENDIIHLAADINRLREQVKFALSGSKQCATDATQLS